ncbi:MAG: twin-arginine translocation signal protein [Chitinophagaceae bacterium]|nr:twin-arginine translocation signal protein [Chitinophagaceae bacterium]
MNNKRRDFIKLTGMTGVGIAGSSMIGGFAATFNNSNQSNILSTVKNKNFSAGNQSIIGQYGEWATGLTGHKLPSLSFRKKEFTNLEAWRKTAKQRLTERLAIPDIGGLPKVNINKQYSYDGLHIEELSWQLPYGHATEAILLKPVNSKERLPAILAFHDHGGNKYFGKRKITRTSDQQHPLMVEHQNGYYEGLAWANEIAKRGYVVLVADAFPFASRRVMLQDVPEHLRGGLNDEDPENADKIAAYNKWAGEHEHTMAKSLFSAGTTWPGVFYAEDRKALDILCARPDVDANHVGCAGLSGGGMRTVFMGAQDERIQCAVCVGFMTTWKDFVLNKSFTHTWMTYVPLLPNELDFPEILGLRVPLPTLVLNDSDDQLYTLDEMKQADKIISEVYSKAKAADKYKCSYYPGPHKFDRAMQKEAFDWFDRWLKA